ncbi:MAG TPA: DMT family transporter [Paenirhodobacter sp.]
MTAKSPAIPPLAWVFLAGLALLWGTSFLSNRLVLQGMGPFTTVFFRTAGAAILLWAVAVARCRPVRLDPRIIGNFIVLGLISCAMPFSLIVWGQQYITSGLTAILSASSAVLGVASAALVFRDEQLTPRRLIGVLLGFAGVIVAIGPETLDGISLTSVGQFAILGSSLCYALSGVYTRVASRGVAPEIAAAALMTTAALWMAPLMLIVEGMPRFDWPMHVSMALIWLIVACTTIAYLLYFRLLALAGAGNSALVTLLIPPVAIAAGVIVLGERLTLTEVLGFLIIAVGLCILSGWPGRRVKTP